MLSRPASNTNNNLRRARSTTFNQPHSSPAIIVDPVAVKQHALVAATVAYERAHEKETITQRKQQPPELRRRRSNRTGKFEGEGSHFSECKTSRHRSSKRLSNSSDAANHYPRSRRGTISSSVSVHEFAPQSCLSRMPSTHTIHEDSEKFKRHRSSISIHKLRKAKSMYSPPSHIRVGSIDDITFHPSEQVSQLVSPLEETIAYIPELNMDETVDIKSNLPMPLTRINLENISERFEDVAAHPGTDPHLHSIRHRASLMLTPFKRRKEKCSAITQLPTTPPELSPSFANVVRLPGPVATVTPRFDQRRASSGTKKVASITERIRSVFRRTSAPIHELPVQQVNASRAYFGTSLQTAQISKQDLFSPNEKTRGNSRSSLISLHQPVVAADNTSLSHANFSIGTKSRVTSWADSTVAGTIVEAIDENNLAMIEDGSKSCEVAIRTENKHTALNLFRRMRRTSRADINKSELEKFHSEGGESCQGRRAKSRTLQHRSPHMGRARETLPSQIHKATDLTKTSVRAVFSNVNGVNFERPHNLEENLPGPSLEHNSSDQSAPSTIRRRKKLQKGRSLHIAAPPPTTEQIAERVKRSDERWQQPLDGGHSLFYPRSPKGASPGRHSGQISDTKARMEQKTLPEDMFSSVQESSPSRSVDVISPSIYSEDGNGQNLDNAHELSTVSSAPPRNGQGSAIIITGHVATRYSVGSPKLAEATQPRQTSREWRNWLQEEIQDLHVQSPDGLKLSTEFVARNPHCGHHKEFAQINNETENEEGLLSSESESTENLAIQKPSIPSLEWRPNQTPRITQHTSESSIRSTTTSARSHLQVHPSLNEEEEECLMTSFAPVSDHCATSSGPNKVSYRYGEEDRPSSRLHDIDERSSVVNRPSSRMNERFPYINSSRPQSRTSGRSSTPAQSFHSRGSRPGMVQRIQSASEKNKENHTPSPAQSLPTRPPRPRPVIRRPVSTAALGKSRSSLAQYTTSELNASPAASLPPTPQPSLLPRPTQSSPSRPIVPRSHTFSADISVQKLKHISMPSLETDPTLASILQGPYRNHTSPRPLSIRKIPSHLRDGSPRKENSAPGTPKTEASVTPTSGQKLAEQFLNARRFREDMRVMSPGEGSPMSTLSGAEFGAAFL